MARFSLVVRLGLFPFINVCGYLLSGVDRNVVATLNVSNGADFGFWATTQYCPRSMYAVGYKMKVEPPLDGDDTALNGISLVCKTIDGQSGGEITSGVGEFGTWYNPVYCPYSNSNSNNLKVMIQFNLRVEPNQGSDDDTAANDIQFKCNNIESIDTYYDVVIRAPGGTNWGSWVWSNTCPHNSGICGIQTSVEHGLLFGDDTSLNDVKVFCCQD